jgi:hypothetical protein
MPTGLCSVANRSTARETASTAACRQRAADPAFISDLRRTSAPPSRFPASNPGSRRSHRSLRSTARSAQFHESDRVVLADRPTSGTTTGTDRSSRLASDRWSSRGQRLHVLPTEFRPLNQSKELLTVCSSNTIPDFGHRRCPLRDSVAREAGDGSIGLPAPSRIENRISVAPLLRVNPLSPYPPLAPYRDAVGVAGRPAAMSFSTIALRLSVVSTQRVTATRSFSQSM